MEELAYQVAYERLYPAHDDRTEFMLAQLTAAFVQANSKKGTKVNVMDFMLSEQMRDKTQSNDIESQIRATFSLFPKKE